MILAILLYRKLATNLSTDIGANGNVIRVPCNVLIQETSPVFSGH